MKVIKFNTPKGQYYIPLLPVAENRADYYATEVDGDEKGSDGYNEEVKWVMDDDYEAIDWLINNSNFEDWSEISVKLNDEVKVTDDDFWCDSDDFDIVEN